MKRGWGVALLMLSMGCATSYNPYQISRGEFSERVRTIAIAPLVMRSTIADRDALERNLELHVREILERSGFEVVPIAVMSELWARAAADIGAPFDPKTGEKDEARFDLIQETVQRDLASVHRADALLYLQIEVIELNLPDRDLVFCGTEAEAYWPAAAPPLGRWEDPALVRVACLNVDLVDTEDRSLYRIRSGLEPLETYARGTRAIRPKKERFQDLDRIRETVTETLSQLQREP